MFFFLNTYLFNGWDDWKLLTPDEETGRQQSFKILKKKKKIRPELPPFIFTSLCFLSQTLRSKPSTLPPESRSALWGTLSLTPLSLPSPWVYVAGSKLHRFCDFGFRGLSQPLTEADTAPLVSLGLTGFRATVGGGRGGGGLQSREEADVRTPGKECHRGLVVHTG